MVEFVNQPQTAAEMEKVRQCIQRGRPYGNDAWTARAAAKLGLEMTLRPRGRPRKTEEEKASKGY